MSQQQLGAARPTWRQILGRVRSWRPGRRPGTRKGTAKTKKKKDAATGGVKGTGRVVRGRVGGKKRDPQWCRIDLDKPVVKDEQWMLMLLFS